MQYNYFCDTDNHKTINLFMAHLMTLSGVLWFFNGSRFDNFILLKFLMEEFMIHGIKICHEKTLIRNNAIMVLAIYTTKSILIIKDLARFLQGSLLWNCKGFDIPKEYWKDDFDHNKCKTWADVITFKEERLDYLRKDVISQAMIYIAFAEAIYSDYSLNVCDFVSIAQLSYAACTLFIKPGRLLKMPLDDEAPFREAYYGGRIVMTRPYWFSKDFDKVVSSTQEEIEVLYSSIDSHLKYYDANSLYPSVMFNCKIPGGKALFREVTDSKCDIYIDRIIEESEGGAVEDWIKKLIKVDMTCPKDIYIPYLMRRDEDGRNEQVLFDIVGKWYTGVDILEAIRVGYTLTKVYCYYSFPYYEQMFSKFVEEAYAKRKAHPENYGNNAINQTQKIVLNANSGKHAQIVIYKKEKLLIGLKEISETRYQCGESVWNSSKDEMLGLFVKENTNPTHTSHSLPVSVWILSESRTYMSKFTRMIDGYRNAENVPNYGDTDSLFVLNHVISLFKNDTVGKELGQMKDEMPNCKIIGKRKKKGLLTQRGRTDLTS